MDGPRAGRIAEAASKSRGQRGEFYTVAEAADVLGVSVSTVWRWIEANRLPAYRLGPKAIRIKKQDLDAAIRPRITRQKEVAAVSHAMPVLTDIRPLTRDETRRGLRLLEKAAALRRALRSRRGGRPLPASWGLIRQAREERSERR